MKQNIHQLLCNTLKEDEPHVWICLIYRKLAGGMQMDSLRYLATVALKAGGKIMYRQSGDEACVLGS